jgi:hypothetical protein
MTLLTLCLADPALAWRPQHCARIYDAPRSDLRNFMKSLVL